MKPIIIANWKSHKTTTEAENWVTQLAGLDWTKLPVKLVVAPPFSLLPIVSQLIDQKKLPWGLAAQDISPFPPGAYTGAVSSRNLDGLGLTHVVVGHSERRQYFDESNQDVAKKVDQVLAAGWQAVVCIDDDNWQAQGELLTDISSEKIWFAYEPKGSIGTGQAADVGRVKAMRQSLEQMFGTHPFIYGGSVDESNIGQYLIVSDGALVGGASLDSTECAKLFKAIAF